MDVEDLKNRHTLGVEIISERGYLDRLLSEVSLLMKYIDNSFFLRQFSENLIDDMRGVFSSFVNQDLAAVFEEMQQVPELPISVYLEREYMNLTILLRCTSNIRYQVKSLSRMPRINALKMKSSFLQAVSRKLNGEVQNLYHQLSDNYKRYFRQKFTMRNGSENTVSLGCIDKLHSEFDAHFLSIMNKFYQLSDAIQFVRSLIRLEIENEIRTRIANLFFDQQDKLEKMVNYFIQDMKRNFIRTLDRHRRSGRDFDWIRNAFLQFIDSAKFEALTSRIIYQTLAVNREEKPERSPADIF